MRLSNAPATVVAMLTLLPITMAKPAPTRQITTQIEVREVMMTADIDIEKRQCTACGWQGQLCCETGTTCGTNELNQAVCVPDSQAAPAPTGAPSSGCSGAQVECGSICCDSGYWCKSPLEEICDIIPAGSSPGVGNPSAPLRPTASTLVVITQTGSITRTVSFETPIPTGVNGTPLPAEDGGGGLSGGAIAGIVIGVILGIILLLLLCLYCCAKTVFDGFAALLGFGKKRKHTHEETYIEEHHHHSHHGSAAGAAMGGRRWYGQGPARPSRPPPKKKNSGFGGALGIGAGLAGLAIALGLKRKHDRRYDDDKTTTVSGSSGYTYSDYTSASELSSEWSRI